jgi:glycosyltransferase involved in cell wall biosynthesis
MQKTLTIFTPAYNRAHTLHLGYEALLRQTCNDFEWLIIDDGSTDNTRELVEGWIAEGKIDIRYHYQENQGMHGAHNTAYRLIETELNTCIDSDDYMPDDAVEKIVNFWKEHGNENVAGIIGLDRSTKGKIIGSLFPEEMKSTTLLDFYESGGKGDKKLVYRTDVIKEIPEYPIFEGEKYVGLACKYYQIDKKYKLLTMNEVLCIVEYQEDGSSMNMFKQYKNNPRGFAYYRKQEMVFTKSLRRRFIVCAHYVASSIISKNRNFLFESPCKILTFIAIPVGWALYAYIMYKNYKGDYLKVKE